MDAGKLRERITIRRQVNAKNARGGLDRTWSTVASDVSAEVIGINGRESVIGHVLVGVSTYQITVRHRDDLRASDQILWRDLELNIQAADDRRGTRQWLTIVASTQAPQGAGA